MIANTVVYHTYQWRIRTPEYSELCKDFKLLQTLWGDDQWYIHYTVWVYDTLLMRVQQNKYSVCSTAKSEA